MLCRLAKRHFEIRRILHTQKDLSGDFKKILGSYFHIICIWRHMRVILPINSQQAPDSKARHSSIGTRRCRRQTETETNFAATTVTVHECNNAGFKATRNANRQSLATTRDDYNN